MLAYYRNFIYLTVVLGFLSYSHLVIANVTVESASDNTEASAPSSDTISNETEARGQVQEMRTMTSDIFQMPDYRFEFTGLFGLTNISNSPETGLLMNVFTGDILYRIIQYDRWNSSLGLRIRANLKDDNPPKNDFTEFHELTFLIQNLVFFEKKLFSIKMRGFIGPVFGIHIWKYFRVVTRSPEQPLRDVERKSSEFFRGYFSYQFGMKSGVMLSSHFAFTMDLGFDQLRFSKYTETIGDLGTDTDTETEEVSRKSLLNNIYITLGISYFL